MAQQANLTVSSRTATGKGAARTMRREGKVPGVIYGHGREAESVIVETAALKKMLGGISAATTIGHSLFVRDLQVPKAKVLNDPDTPICTVVAPRAEEAPAAVVTEEPAVAEPELIRKPKAEAEGEAEEKA